MLYGATIAGGPGLRGVVYRLNKDGSGFGIVKSFANTVDDGGNIQYFKSIIVSGGTIYGATFRGGGANRGTVFRVNTDSSGFSVMKHLGSPDGAGIFTPLSEGASGALYGSTLLGGSTSEGTLFKVNKDGTGHVVLHHFTAGSSYSQAAIEASNGVLYGPWSNQLYRINPDGTGFASIHTFGAVGDGGGPLAVIEGSDGALYGTSSGGAANLGAVFKINKDGSGYTILRSFTGGATDGQYPYHVVVEGRDGVLYGTTSGGGTAGLGTVYRVNKDGTGYAVLKQFAGGTADGASPWTSVIHGSDGLLYGVTHAGGAAGLGTIYRMSTDGTGFMILRSFLGTTADGSDPGYSSLVESNGLLYGTTSTAGAFGRGTLYRIQRDGSDYTTIINFGGLPNEGNNPEGTLLRASDGALYGTTYYGPDGSTIFRFQIN